LHTLWLEYLMQKYIYREYDPRYLQYYSVERQLIADILGEFVLIEHVGSTAVPGLGGKGFIDILVGVPRAEMRLASDRLIADGYVYDPEASTVDRLYHEQTFIDYDGRESKYHVHLTYPNSQDWKALIAFRDYLRAHPDSLQEYANIKKFAAYISNQKRKIYVGAKNPVVEKILHLALAHAN
jgi:GrpB-like predicted nucleotidyltransferase (UPF0157 family)